MNQKGFPNFTAYSAGSHPTGRVNPAALRQIESAGMPTEVCAVRVGMNSRNPIRQKCILSLLSATRLRRSLSDMARSAAVRSLGRAGSGWGDRLAGAD